MNQENKSEGSERNGSLSQYDMDGVSSASFTDEFSRLVSYCVHSVMCSRPFLGIRFLLS